MLSKKFALFEPHVYEECRFLEGCRDKNKAHCHHCRVMLMRDRFLGENVHRKITGSANGNPYILIANNAGCNLTCWYCYAHNLIHKSDYDLQNPTFLNPQELADCFLCKIQMSHQLKDSDKDRFFSRIRITGGEPLFATADTLLGKGEESYQIATIDYYLQFFNYLNSGIDELVSSKTIKLSPPLLYSKDLGYPVWLETKPGRINVRFDTNGIVFSDRNAAEKFINGIKNGNFNRLHIEIDYSLKGAHPIEFYWTCRKQLPVDDRLEQDYNIEQHPQFKGLKNITEILGDAHGGLAVSLTLERGINHAKTGVAFVNTPTSLRWDIFISKLNKTLKLEGERSIKFSEVDNPFRSANQYGYLFSRYHNMGAGIIAYSGNESYIYLPSDSTSVKKQLKVFIKQKKATGEKVKVVFYPADFDNNIKGSSRKVDIFKPIDSQVTVTKQTSNVWILTGNDTNWEVALKNNIWGVRAGYEELKSQLKVGDYVFFYVARPVSGLIGCGIYTEDYNSMELIWDDEKKASEVLYPIRFKFNVLYVLDKNLWITNSTPLSGSGIDFRHGLNAVPKGFKVGKLLRIAKEEWKVSL